MITVTRISTVALAGTAAWLLVAGSAAAATASTPPAQVRQLIAPEPDLATRTANGPAGACPGAGRFAARCGAPAAASIQVPAGARRAMADALVDDLASRIVSPTSPAGAPPAAQRALQSELAVQ